MNRTVIDQPGVRILIIGLGLSIFIGLALRWQISETRVQVFLSRAIDRLQTDFHIDYESGKVSLSRWGLPFPALVVQKIRLSPKSMLCQSSQVYIEELEVPISILTILGVSKTISKIRINEVELRLSDIDKCIGQHKSRSYDKNIKVVSVAANSESESAEVSFKNIFTNKTKAEFKAIYKEIYIEKLKIISSKKTDQPVLLKQLNLELFYTQNRLSEVRLKARLSALKDARSEVYFLNSDFVATFRATNANEIESVFNINGKLLDGDAQFFAHSFTGSNKFSYELTLERVSVKALLPLIEHFKVGKSINFDKTPISISLKNSGSILFNEKQNLESKFKNVQINVENGLLKINEIELSYADSRLSVKPFHLTIESLPLSNLKNFEQFKNKLDSFESLGLLSGILEYKNENSYKISGAIKNIQAVFSNRGRRDLQNIEHVEINIFRQFDDLKLEALNFMVNNEKVEGSVKGHYNMSSLNITAQLKLNGASLNNKIWEQVTFVEQSPKVDVLWNYKKNNHEAHNIKIYIDKIFLPNLSLIGLNVDINQIFSNQIKGNSLGNSLNVSIRPAQVTSDQEFLKNNIVRQVLNSKNGFKQNVVSSHKTSLTLSGSDWKNIDFNLDSYFLSEPSARANTHLSLKGSVKYQEGLSAMLLLTKRNFLLKFDLKKNPDDEIKIRSIQ